MPDGFGFAALGGAAAFVCATLLTGMIRTYAMRHQVLDVPGTRSGHTRPVPLGGGLAIATTVLLGTLFAHGLGWLPERVALALLFGGVAIALLGWHDDRRPLPPRWRLVAQVVIAGFAVALLGGLPSLDLGFMRVTLGALGAVLATAAFVWLINLYNFMDGSDGLAGSQAVVAGLAGASLAFAHDAPGLAMVGVLVGAASGGFLVWNWSPAKIFMGDGGSCFLGFVFAVLTFAGENSAGIPALLWMLPLALFVADATLTVIRRSVRGARLAEAHRDHAYQRLIDGGRCSHRAVAVSLIAMNVTVLWPATWLASRYPDRLLAVIAGVYVALALGWWWVQRRWGSVPAPVV